MVVFASGCAVGGWSLWRWSQERQPATAVALIAIALVVVMSRFPLVLTHRSADVVIGFETCSLVFVVLTVPPVEALALWSLGMAVADGTARKPWRARIFNIGLTTMGGALLVLVVALIDPRPDENAMELAAVMLGCAIYFMFDLVMTAGSLALEDRSPWGSVLRWRSVPLGLACFVSVDTLGYLAALLARSQPAWTLLLLAVPVGTILVAVRSVSSNVLAQRRLSGLLEAATQAPDWSDEDEIEASLIVQAQRTLRHSTATFTLLPPVPPDIGAPVEMEGRPLRYLVARRLASGQLFDAADQAALDALTAVGVSALNRRRLAAEMNYLARHDALTGLHNRAVFIERLTHALGKRRGEGTLAVLFCDLDGFKAVNDALGHDAGDHLLAAVALRLRTALRPADTAARLGGDEFGVLLDDLVEPDGAESIASRLLEVLTAPFDCGDQEIRVQASIGVAYATADRVGAEELLNNADTAMYEAKALGKGRAERFDPAMRDRDVRRLELEKALREAVAADLIGLHYQPIVDLDTGRIEAFEALARWTDPTLGRIDPETFISVAERLGLIRVLGLQLLEKAHRGALQLSTRAGRPLSLGVNLSAMQIGDPALASRVEELLRHHPQVPLVLELTESILLGDDSSTVESLHRLKACGALLAVDDFGVGYSSVGYLHRLPVDILKIDKLFVQQLHDARSLALVKGVMAMADAMDLTVITEGVEDWGNAAIVRNLPCRLAQGYLFSRPVDLAQALLLAEAGSVDVTPIRAQHAPVGSRA